jgi:SHS2 domain-containing protein
MEADSLGGLFRLAAEGLVGTLGLPSASGRAPDAAETMELRRADLERLLVAWLRELLVRAQVNRETPRIGRLAVAPEEEGFALRASVSWTAGEGPTREVKAVTYHGLRVERSGEGWSGCVILDV